MGYNPAIAAFNAGMAAGAKRRQEDVQLERDMQKLDEDRLSAPYRVSRLSSDSRIAGTAADVAEQTKGANVRIVHNTAQQGELRNADMSVDLGEKRATSPSRVGATIATNTATAEEAPLGTEDKRLGVSERKQTSPYRVQATRDAAVVSGVKAKDAQLDFLKQISKLLDEGRNSEADELARRTGETIPDSLKNESGLRRALSDAVKDAERFYPDSPRRQKEHIGIIVEEAKKRGGANVTPTSPRMDPLPGLPQAQETKTNAKSQTALQQNIPFLIQTGIAKNEQDAFRLLNQSRNDYQGTIKELYRDEYKRRTEAAKGPGGYGAIDNVKLNQIDNEAMQAAVAAAKRLREIGNEIGVIPTPSSPGTATTGAPAAAAPAPAPLQQPASPAVPPAPEKKPGWWDSWWNGKNSAAKPSGSAPSIRDYQTPAAPPKQEERAPGGAPAAGSTSGGYIPATPEQKARAGQYSPEQIKQRARERIAAGEPRERVLQRLQELGVDTSGL